MTIKRLTYVIAKGFLFFLGRLGDHLFLAFESDEKQQRGNLFGMSECMRVSLLTASAL